MSALLRTRRPRVVKCDTSTTLGLSTRISPPTIRTSIVSWLLLLSLMPFSLRRTSAFTVNQSLNIASPRLQKYISVWSPPTQNDSTATGCKSQHSCFNSLRSGSRRSSTSLSMFMGSDGGLLGVGGPEIFTILLVGYFVLGPSDLYKIVKEIGKFIQNIRTLGTDLSTTFENNMESTLQLEELRKAQRELNDAFSFRRSINTDTEIEALTNDRPDLSLQDIGTGTAVAAVSKDTSETALGKKKKIRRRVRRQPENSVAISTATENIPDLEMPPTELSGSIFGSSTADEAQTAEELRKIDEDFDKYVNPTAKSWIENDYNMSKDDESVSQSDGTATTTNAAEENAAQNRFQQQISGDWNNQVLAAGDKLEPMALVMNKIALLEKEKKTALERLEEEFAQRKQLENQFYMEQRQLLEEAAAKVQSAAFGLDDAVITENSVTSTTTKV